MIFHLMGKGHVVNRNRYTEEQVAFALKRGRPGPGFCELRWDLNGELVCSDTQVGLILLFKQLLGTPEPMVMLTQRNSVYGQ